MAQAKTAPKQQTSTPDEKPAAKVEVEEISPIAKVAREAPKQLTANQIQPEGTAWGRWAVMAKAEHTIHDALSPIYLYARADQMRGGDYIEIKHPFGYWVVCLDVVRVDRQARGIVSHVRHVFDYTKDARTITPDLAGAVIQHLGARNWAIVDGRHVVADDFPSQEAAQKWLEERKAA